MKKSDIKNLTPDEAYAVGVRTAMRHCREVEERREQRREHEEVHSSQES